MAGLEAHGLALDRHPFHIVGKGIGQELVKLVPTGVAHHFAEEAGADAEFYLFQGFYLT